MTEDTIFFTTIAKPKKVRKGLLESSKEVITILKDYQMLLQMREEKQEKTNQLKQKFEELNGLMDHLNNFLPEEAMHELNELMPKEEEPEEQKEEQEPQDEEESEAPEEEKQEADKGSEEAEPEEPQEEQEPEKEEKPENENIAKLQKALSDIESKLNQI